MPANVVAIVLGLPFNVACAYYSGQVAGRRGRSVRTWIWMGAIFGPFAFPVLYLLPRYDPKNHALRRTARLAK